MRVVHYPQAVRAGRAAHARHDQVVRSRPEIDGDVRPRLPDGSSRPVALFVADQCRRGIGAIGVEKEVGRPRLRRRNVRRGMERIDAVRRDVDLIDLRRRSGRRRDASRATRLTLVSYGNLGRRASRRSLDFHGIIRYGERRNDVGTEVAARGVQIFGNSQYAEK